MIIKISNLSDGVHNYSFKEPVKEIGLSEYFTGEAQADVELKKSHNQIILDAKLTLKANFECDRCTKEFEQTLETGFKMVYLFGKDEAEDTSMNITYLPVDADKINLDKDVRDFAVLAVPMKKLCIEDCKGLCIKCGKNLNEGDCGCEKTETDDRWLPLKDLKNKLNIN